MNKKKSKKGKLEKFKDGCSSNWKETLLVVILFIILNNNFIYSQYDKIIPYNFKFGNPPYIAIIINSIIAGIIFLIISKYVLSK